MHFSPNKSLTQHPACRSTGGFTLVELMVSIMIGLAVVGALYSSYFATVSSSKHSRAVAQVSEDASVALNILRNFISSAGYLAPVSRNGNAFSYGGKATRGVFGCTGNFDNASLDIDNLTCASPVTGKPAIAVSFEAAIATNAYASGGKPVDCLGNQITATTVGALTYYLSDSRFYINNNELYCRSPGATGGQALVENVTDMQITYGLKANGSTADSVVAYKTADSITGAEWALVEAVRICLIVRSADEVMESVTDYQGCNPFAANLITPTDRRLYRAFTSTIVLANRSGLPA